MEHGSKRSSAKTAPGNSQGGNTGKPVGDKGRKSSKGNMKTKVPGDRY
jgi:hypothetical protein